MRFSTSVLLLASASVVHAQSSKPTFSKDWSADEDIFNVVYQGDYIQDDNYGYCCPSQSNCQVQVGSGTRTRYFSHTLQMTRDDDKKTGEIIITDFKNKKEVAVDSSLACIEYCPISGSLDPFDPLYEDSVDVGKDKIDGKAVEHWQFNDTIFKRVVMQSSNTYVDQSDPTDAIPVFEHDTLTPFGMDLGFNNETWSNWKSGAQDPKLFAYTPGSQGCPMAKNCQSSKVMQRRLLNKDYKSFLEIAYERGFVPKEKVEGLRIGAQHKNKHAVRALREVMLRAKNADVPTFPQDFSADTQDGIVIPQGDFKEYDGQYFCCSTTSNCKVQTEYQAGPSYVSFSTNQTRLGVPGAAQAIVADYNMGKEFLVDGNNTCKSYCPLQEGAGMVPLVVDPSAQDQGKVTIDGNAYEHWQWKDTILKGRVTMDIVDAFVDQSDSANPVPYLIATTLTPFNQFLGYANATYTNFKGGPQSPDMFTVSGVSACPLDSSCQPSSSPVPKRVIKITDSDMA